MMYFAFFRLCSKDILFIFLPYTYICDDEGMIVTLYEINVVNIMYIFVVYNKNGIIIPTAYYIAVARLAHIILVLNLSR